MGGTGRGRAGGISPGGGPSPNLLTTITPPPASPGFRAAVILLAFEESLLERSFSTSPLLSPSLPSPA